MPRDYWLVVVRGVGLKPTVRFGPYDRAEAHRRRRILAAKHGAVRVKVVRL